MAVRVVSRSGGALSPRISDSPWRRAPTRMSARLRLPQGPGGTRRRRSGRQSRAEQQLEVTVFLAFAKPSLSAIAGPGGRSPGPV